MTNDAVPDYLTRPESCRKAADKSRPTLLIIFIKHTVTETVATSH